MNDHINKFIHVNVNVGETNILFVCTINLKAHCRTNTVLPTT